MNVLRKFFPALIVPAFGAVILFSAMIGLLPETKQGSFLSASSPVYLISWGVLLLLSAVRPWIYPAEAKKLISFLRQHASLAALGIAAGGAFLTSRTADVPLLEGGRIEMSGVYDKLGLDGGRGGDAVLELKKFEVIPYPDDRRAVQSYRSTLGLRTGGRESERVLEVNAPVKIGSISLYQKSWSLELRKTDMGFLGLRYSFNDRLAIRLQDGRLFVVQPSGFDEVVLYRWLILSAAGEALAEGALSKHGVPAELSRFDIAIVDEDFAFVSVLQANYEPFHGILAVTSILYLLILAADFFFLGRVRAGGAGS